MSRRASSGAPARTIVFSQEPGWRLLPSDVLSSNTTVPTDGLHLVPLPEHPAGRQPAARRHRSAPVPMTPYAGESGLLDPPVGRVHDPTARAGVRPAFSSAPALVHHVRCGDCGAANDVPSLPTVCYRCGWPVGL